MIIKFRAWLKEYKEMRQVEIIFLDRNEAQVANGKKRGNKKYDIIWHYFDEIELMQYTGIQDKAGKDIFEGDIVQIRPGMCFIVKFKEAELCLFGIPEDDYVTKSLSMIKYYTHYEVIGNIYEHPKLLESK